MLPPPRLYRLALLFPLLVLVYAIAGCANLNPIAIAETPEQRYAAVKLTYDALLTPAVELVEDITAPTALRRVTQEAVNASGDIYRSLNAAYVDYLIARETFVGAEREERLAVATANLERWIGQLDQHIDRIATALKR